MSTATRSYSTRKVEYCQRLLKMLDEFPKFLLVTADNVGSRHMQSIRSDLRGAGVLIMGKNTLIRKALRNPESFGLQKPDAVKKSWANIANEIKSNIGFVFSSNTDLGDLKAMILKNQVGAAAKAGLVAPCDVFVPKGPTGMDPTQTSFFQALNIATMISKGQIEIKQDVHLIKEGDKVGASEATLLQRLNIRPFFYGLKVILGCDEGTLFAAAVLDITAESLRNSFNQGCRSVAAISIELGTPNITSVPHSLINALNAVVAVSIESSYTIKQAEAIKAYLADPSKFVVAAASSVAASSAPVEEAKPEEKAESEEVDMGGGGIFGGDDAADY